jgi:acyl transferase domain-containing protein
MQPPPFSGTQAGDPREAEGICTAFFPSQSEEEEDDADRSKLRVGSIKTVIGHLEGWPVCSRPPSLCAMA